MPKGSDIKYITGKILGVIADGAISTTAVFLAIAESSYGTSYRKMQRSVDEIESDLRKPLIDPQWIKDKQRFYNMLSKLRRDELIEKKADGWVVTAMGKLKLASYRKRPPNRGYIKKQDNLLKIVIFDIPEKFRHKRAWLRGQLSSLGFKMIQQSVWAGKVEIPHEFITDLKDLEMINYVDIFEVTKTGSLRQI